MIEFKAEVSEALKGHTSMETAYLVEDYPYGFKLRCQIRYWLEFKKGKGFRFVRQTTNPKINVSNGNPGDNSRHPWNKPKASTYVENAAFMYLDSNGHVQWHGLGIYNDAKEARAFLEAYGQHVNAEWLPVLERWISLKTAYENIREARKASEPAVETVVYNVNFGGGGRLELEVKK